MPADVSTLADMQFFQLLDHNDRCDLAKVVDLIQLPAGEKLFEEGDPGDTLFIVRSGAIEIYVRDTTGQKIVLTTVGKDESFGEIAVIDSQPRSASAVALADSELIALDREDLLLLFQRRPVTALHMLA